MRLSGEEAMRVISDWRGPRAVEREAACFLPSGVRGASWTGEGDGQILGVLLGEFDGSCGESGSRRTGVIQVDIVLGLRMAGQDDAGVGRHCDGSSLCGTELYLFLFFGVFPFSQPAAVYASNVIVKRRGYCSTKSESGRNNKMFESDAIRQNSKGPPIKRRRQNAGKISTAVCKG